MPYLVGDLIKEIESGGPIANFPQLFTGPPKLSKEKEEMELDAQKAKTAKDTAAAKAKEEPQEDWVKKKWARYYELNEMGYVKPNFDKMTYAQFEQYMIDAQEQGKHRLAAASTHLGLRYQPVARQQKTVPQSTAAPPGSNQRKRKVVAPVAEPQFAVDPESRPRKKPRVKAHVIKAEYLKKH